MSEKTLDAKLAEEKAADPQQPAPAPAAEAEPSPRQPERKRFYPKH